MRKSLLVLAIGALSGLFATEAQAQVSFGAHANWASEMDIGLGGRANIAIPQVANLSVVPSVDIFFPGNGGVSGVSSKWYELNGNVHYAFPLPDNPKLLPYAGGGLNIVRFSSKVDLGEFGSASGSDTKAGLNLLGGVRFGAGPLKPFAEAKYETVGLGQFVLTGGINF